MYTKGFLHTLPTMLHSSLVQQFSKKRCADACSSSIIFFPLKNIPSFQISLYLNIKIEKWAQFEERQS